MTASITAADKVYDGTTDASYTCSPNGIIAPDVVTCNGAQPAHFGNKNVGQNKTVTATGLALAGADNGNYNLTNTSATDLADITAKDVTASITAADKVYDGTTDASYTCSPNGIIAPDVVTCNGASRPTSATRTWARTRP